MQNIKNMQAGPECQKFPDDFVWGVATAAFQIEGAATTDGRGDSIWDTFCRKAGTIADGSDGSVACDHYHRWQEDLNLMQAMGVDAYRFSLSWPRLQPDGMGAWNAEGWNFYDRLIDGMLERGLQPFATLYHWDLPEALQQQGGWGNRATCLRFAEYAQEVATRFGDRLASIATHNEPWVVANLGHESGIFAPGIKDRKLAMQVSHHLLLSHGMAVRAMREVLGPKQVPMGIVLNQSPIYPETASEPDLARATLDDGLVVRWYMDPLFKGSYPADAIEHLGADAPQIEPGDLEIIASPIDFVGINYYTRQIVSAEHGTYRPVERGLPVTDMGWEVYPEGLTDLLQRLHRDYRLPDVYITENGAAFPDLLETDGVHDAMRTDYLQRHILAVQRAIESGVGVRGYFVWSLLDNFEWASGYAKRFGIVHVDYKTLQRTPKDSARWYQQFLSSRS